MSSDDFESLRKNKINVHDNGAPIFEANGDTRAAVPSGAGTAVPAETSNVRKSLFDRRCWNFGRTEDVESKKRKFQTAIGICEENCLGSKAKMRRLRMKIDRWSVENDRDIDALMSDYERLLDLIGEFETR